MAAIDPGSTLAQIVTEHPDLARELERRSLDYCCGGARTFDEACRSAGLDPTATARELNELTSAAPEAWTAFDAVELVDHIEATHHAYLHEELPRLVALAGKVATVHGANHPELIAVRDAVLELRTDLVPHLAKEEQVVFPLIRTIAAEGFAPMFHRGTLEAPISVLLGEHDQVGALLEGLRRTTSDYVVPADGCASYAALYRGLDALEADTHLHVHKENNRLFPLVLELEARQAEPAEAANR